VSDMNRKLKKKEALMKGDTQSQEEAKSISDSKPDTTPSESLKEEHKPFYKKVEFYISIIALLLSILSLYFSFLNSPLSSFTRPHIEYESTTTLVTMPKESAGVTLMVGSLKNDSNAPAEEVIVNIATLTEGKPEEIMIEGIEYSIVKKSDTSTTIKFPNIPPKYRVLIFILSSPKPIMTALKNTSGEERLPCISSVIYKNGVGIPLGNSCKRNEESRK
jgi:hypothetical protein